MHLLNHRLWLTSELLLVSVGLPLLLWLVLPARYILPLLWLLAAVCYLAIRRLDPNRLQGSWDFSALNRRNLAPMLLRFAFCAALLAGLTWWLKPELLFNFVLRSPGFWLVVMVAYPIASVIAQEIIYRRFFFIRYRALLPTPFWMILISGIAFGLGHILFNNWVAPLLCVIGGVLFSMTYHKTRSLALVCLEHALYGDFIFTIGLGQYFYHGAVGQH